MTAWESELESKTWGRYVSRIKPIVDATGSASDIITRWENFLPMFWKVAPHAPEEGDELVIPERYQEIHREMHRQKVMKQQDQFHALQADERS